VAAAAHELLTSGLKTQSQADVASALQVFFNMGTLRTVCLGTTESYAADVGAALKAATDSRQLGGLVGQGPGKGTAGKAAVRVQEALWQELDTCMKLMHSTVVLVWHLQRVLNKKRDPLTLAAFVDIVQVCAGRKSCWPTQCECW
jgi:conserved oligomeric Golgi complex subunit 5